MATKVLIVAEHLNGKLNASTAKCVSAARDLQPETIDILLLGHNARALAEQAAGIAGVAKVLLVEHAMNAHPIAAIWSKQIAAVAREYTHAFGPSTTFGKDVMPCVAAELDCSMVSEIMQIESAHRFKRPIYAGNAIATVECDPSKKVVATVRTASFQAAGAAAQPAPVVTAEPGVDLPVHTRFVELISGKADRPDLQTATRVVSGGRALGSAENFQIIYRLADRLGAAVGASRAAVDAGYAANDLQVGQTGKIIAPQLYMAIGISGAIQHLTGIKDAGTIVAINKDAQAPIFEIADIGLVGDLFQILPEFEQALKD